MHTAGELYGQVHGGGGHPKVGEVLAPPLIRLAREQSKSDGIRMLRERSRNRAMLCPSVSAEQGVDSKPEHAEHQDSQREELPPTRGRRRRAEGPGEHCRPVRGSRRET